MPNHTIFCPECLAPASKWFEFGGGAERHGYYHCDSCGRSCAVQHTDDGRPGRRTAWVREAPRDSVQAYRLVQPG
jgi:transposase-like protein